MNEAQVAKIIPEVTIARRAAERVGSYLLAFLPLTIIPLQKLDEIRFDEKREIIKAKNVRCPFHSFNLSLTI